MFQHLLTNFLHLKKITQVTAWNVYRLEVYREWKSEMTFLWFWKQFVWSWNIAWNRDANKHPNLNKDTKEEFHVLYFLQVHLMQREASSKLLMTQIVQQSQFTPLFVVPFI